MPKKISNALTPLQVKNAKPGRHADGGGLYLLVKASGARSWVFRFMLNGKSRDMGLSRCPEAIAIMQKSQSDQLTLAEARDLAAIYRLKVKAGIDPLSERQKALAEAAAENLLHEAEQVTFQEAASDYLSAREGTWRNAKHRQQWHNTLRDYVFPVIGDMAVKDVETQHVLRVLEPIWGTKSETASRLRGRIESILDAAKVRGHRTGENPARWRGHLDKILPPRKRLSRGHHAALPYRGIPDFIVRLRERSATGALALEFLILTAARTGEVIGAEWDEINFADRTWTIPAQRMKAAREHRVPLCERAVEILRQTHQLGRRHLFPGPRGGAMSGMAMSMLLRRIEDAVTVHGFRSSFRDWASETTSFPHEVCEAALAHTIGNKSEAAYRRGDLFEKRRLLMNEWADYCASLVVTCDNAEAV
ncbi:site-specific integrase [Roseobacter sp. AzwK-3b]|uniref:tyrosine-type recombinase/integrase n=1 Tax=Roseobacter sp. AzwK-3b TaxID=351016 RepID=UPI0005664E8D|nr:site-specific integrase [Roseobacter sp. AzwK-3b]